jgi:hypothetical protein
MYEWYINDWVHLLAVHPETGKFYYFKDGSFTEYVPFTKQINAVGEVGKFIEAAKIMATNHTVDATRENIPVHSLN